MRLSTNSISCSVVLLAAILVKEAQSQCGPTCPNDLLNPQNCVYCPSGCSDVGLVDANEGSPRTCDAGFVLNYPCGGGGEDGCGIMFICCGPEPVEMDYYNEEPPAPPPPTPAPTPPPTPPPADISTLAANGHDSGDHPHEEADHPHAHTHWWLVVLIIVLFLVVVVLIGWQVRARLQIDDKEKEEGVEKSVFVVG